MELKPLQDINITSSFGPRIHPVTKRKSFHNGVDLAAPVNTPCLAVADGKVVKSTVNYGGPSKGYGYFMVVEHDGFCTLYAHLMQEGLPEGELVKEGQVIAYTGNTGVSSGPHLHFEVHKGKYGPTFFNRVGGRLLATVDPVSFKTKVGDVKNMTKKDLVSDWAKDAQEWGIENGITDGTRPKDTVTREELWVIAQRVQEKTIKIIIEALAKR